ncbi:hypothetical protein RRG08_047343 [Elysia crispata]|uniref:Uncharacterized protein n=1 Tax=Elysia crispata TaxID=231223 RepID=A0AAE1A2D0_9GAST|nr:hypothetical protein RRG08_047343 [Elysia crispata]
MSKQQVDTPLGFPQKERDKQQVDTPLGFLQKERDKQQVDTPLGFPQKERDKQQVDTPWVFHRKNGTKQQVDTPLGFLTKRTGQATSRHALLGFLQKATRGQSKQVDTAPGFSTERTGQATKTWPRELSVLLPSVRENGVWEFPAVTICNMNPVRTSQFVLLPPDGGQQQPPSRRKTWCLFESTQTVSKTQQFFDKQGWSGDGTERGVSRNISKEFLRLRDSRWWSENPDAPVLPGGVDSVIVTPGTDSHLRVTVEEYVRGGDCSDYRSVDNEDLNIYLERKKIVLLKRGLSGFVRAISELFTVAPVACTPIPVPGVHDCVQHEMRPVSRQRQLRTMGQMSRTLVKAVARSNVGPTVAPTTAIPSGPGNEDGQLNELEQGEDGVIGPRTAPQIGEDRPG